MMSNLLDQKCRWGFERFPEDAAKNVVFERGPYDLAGRLVQVMQDGQTIAEYAYDENSNRISAQYGGHLAAALSVCAPARGVITAQVDAQDRLLSYGTCSYAYGANGELQSKTDNGQTTSYQYDEFGNLRQVTLPDGRELSYAIDGLNRRIGKYIDGQLQGTWLYKDQLNPVAELDATGQVVSIFAYGEKSHVPSLMHKNGQTYRFITDHLGSVRQVVHVDSGQVVQALHYDAWGNVLQDSNPGFQPFGYAGGLYDRDTGLVRFGARDYDPVTGRWTAKDPIGFGGGDSNLYGYASNDPVNEIDPEGLRNIRPANPFNAYRRATAGNGLSVTETANNYRQRQLNALVMPRNNDLHEAFLLLPDLTTLYMPKNEAVKCNSFGNCTMEVEVCSCRKPQSCPVGPTVGPVPQDDSDCYCRDITIPAW